MKETTTFIVLGENGAGKGTVASIMADLLHPHGTVLHQSVSGRLTEMLNLRGWPRTRPNYAVVAREIHHGPMPDYLARVVLERQRWIRPDFSIIDGERLEASFYHYVWCCWPKPVVIYVTAPLLLRFMRVRNRQNGKAGENSLTLGEFSHQDRAWNEVDIPKMGSWARYRIENIGNEAQLRADVFSLLRQALPTKAFSPTL